MVDVYADGATLEEMAKWGIGSYVRGFTTNPTLVKQLGVTDYKEFCLEALKLAKGKPVSIEVFADDPHGIAKQAEKIASWGDNVHVKVPIVDTNGKSNFDVIRALATVGYKLNVTAVFTLVQAELAALALNFDGEGTGSIISIFAGRIFDTGVNPAPIFKAMKHKHLGGNKLLWASSRQAYDVVLAQEAGADIITMAPALIDKVTTLFGKSLALYSQETVQMFYNDAKAAGFKI